MSKLYYVESPCGKLFVNNKLASSERRQVLHSNASFVLCSTAELCVTAVSCGASMWRVDWEEEEAEARKQSIAMQAERLLHSSSCDARDVEQLGWGTAGLLPSR